MIKHSRNIQLNVIDTSPKIYCHLYCYLNSICSLQNQVLISYLFQDVIVYVLYGATEYKDLITFFLGGFLVALPLHMMIGYFSISFYSTKDTKSVFYSNAVSTIFAVAVCYSTLSLGVISLVYGVITMSISNFLLISLLYTRKKLN